MLAAMNWPQWLLSVVLICVCLFLMLVILLQRGRGGGISAAFGGGGGSGAFGAKTGDVFTWITCVVAGIFVILAVTANFAFQVNPPETETVDVPAPSIPTPVTLPTEEGEKRLIPFKMGEDGVALPVSADQVPADLKPVTKPTTVTPSTKPEGEPGAAPGSPPSAAPEKPADSAMPAPAATPPNPAPSNPPAEKPKEDPGSP